MIDQLLFKQRLLGILTFCSAIALLGLTSPVRAQSILGCEVIAEESSGVANQARLDYQTRNNNQAIPLQTASNVVNFNLVTTTTEIETTATGVRTAAGNRVVGLGSLIDSFREQLEDNNFSAEEMEAVSLAAISAVARLSDTSSLEGAIAQVKGKMIEAVEGESQQEAIVNLSEEAVATIILGFSVNTLQAMGLERTVAQEVREASVNNLNNIASNRSLQEVTRQVINNVSNSLTSEEQATLQDGREIWSDTLNQTRRGESPLNAGDTLNYHFNLKNAGEATGNLTLPSLSAVATEALKGQGTIEKVSYIRRNGEGEETTGTLGESSQTITLAPNETLELVAEVTLQEGEDETASRQVGFSLGTDCGETVGLQTIAILPPPDDLGDPFGRVTGCNGEILPDYSDFTIGLYEPAPGGVGAIGSPISLTRTEVPDDPSNDIPVGVEPNIENSNPFFLTNEDQGRYSFLLDEDRGQLDEGREYILLVNPSEDSTYGERRIELEIGEVSETAIPITATSLDGEPINLTDPLERTVIEATLVRVPDAETFGLNLAVLNFQAGVCQPQEIDIDKFADRAAAEIGDIVIYRLNIRNLSQDPVDTLTVTDTLPRGINFIADSVRSGIGEEEIDISVEQQQRTVEFEVDNPEFLASGETLNIIYGAEVTPDAQRGSGINTANAQARIRNRTAEDGPVTQELEIRPGILNDCGTLLGKVFVDKNFDGEQQQGEPGVPNAVVYLEDGTRITTDADGVYSLENVCPGYHTAIVDFTSIPDYELAPNSKRREKQSPSRLFQMSPGGMVRVNFAVTPKGEEEK